MNQGRFVVIEGLEGAGKTTAMRMLCGLSLPTSGEATVAGFDVFKENELANLKGNIGIGHVRYSTAGGSHLANCQPLVGRCRKRERNDCQ